MKIYIASSEKHVGKIQEDVYIRDAYRDRGFSCEIVTLENIVKIAEPFDVVILKSIWGYYLHYREFLEQISMLRKKNIKLINDYDFIFWNIDKYKYLCELKYMNTVPTILLNFKNLKKVSEIKNIILQTNKTLNTDILVIKPRISESGYLTFKYDKTKDNRSVITLLKQNKQLNFIAQPYRPDVLTGELSVVIINGILLYGIKRFSGIFTEKKDLEYIEQQKISKQITEQVKLLLNFFVNKFKSLPRICRVDFVKHDSDYELMEIELIDPDLFFRFLPEKILHKCLAGLIGI
jgi:hypothetical protein